MLTLPLQVLVARLAAAAYDLSGHSAPTTWRTAGEADETAKTPFAQQVCEEH